MRALLHTFGTDGDLEPLFALGTTMQQRGHHPLMVINPAYAERCTALGLPMKLTGTYWHIDDHPSAPRYVNPFTAGAAVWNEIYVPSLRPAFETVAEAIERHRPDVFVGHIYCLGGLWAAQQAGIPTVVVNMSPCWWFSSRDPSIYNPMSPPRWINRWMMWSARALTRMIFAPGLRATCAELGLPYREHRFGDDMARAQLNLGMWSPSFRPVAPDDPPGAAVTGFVTAPPSGPLDPRVEAFLDEGDPPIVVGLGTSIRNIGGPIYDALCQAGRALDRRVLLIGTDKAPSTETRVLAVRAVPYAHVFGRAAAVVHHGGMGTCYEALRAGRPMVVIPFIGDQFDNGDRLQRLGVARVVPRSTMSSLDGTARRKGPARLTKALGAVLEDTALAERAAALGHAVSDETDGALGACQHIEQMLETTVAPS